MGQAGPTDSGERVWLVVSFNHIVASPINAPGGVTRRTGHLDTILGSGVSGQEEDEDG